MTKALFTQYAKAKEAIKVLQKELDELQPQILAEMEAIEDKGVELEGVGTFTVIHRKVWKYSSIVDEAKASLDELKAKEEADGQADYEETRGLMFKAVKV